MTAIYCQKLKKETEAMEFAPYPGELGQQILENISAEAWQMWLDRQTMLINEYRLNMLEPNARSYLQEQMQKFLFEDAGDAPAGFVPPTQEK